VEFSLESFHVDHVYYIARKYCEDNAASFGVIPDELENSCTIIVFNNLFAKINEKKTAALVQAQQQTSQKISPQIKTADSVTSSSSSSITYDPILNSPKDDDTATTMTMTSYPVRYRIV